MQNILLEATVRDVKKKPKALRGKGRVPAVYYGREQKNSHLELDAQKFKKLYSKAGDNTVIDLDVGGKKFPVLVHEVQYDPMTDNIVHVDFLHVDMTKEVTTTVKVVVIGTSPAVKNMGGVLDVLKHELKIRCLPKHLIHSVEVDVSPIVDFHTSVRVKDVKMPADIKVLDNLEDPVVTATPPRKEEETQPAPAATAEGAAAPAEGVVPQSGGTPAAGAAAVAGAPAAPKK